MTPLSKAEQALVQQALQGLRETLEQERASGEPPDTSWTDDLPDDPLPEEEDETSVTFLTKPK